MSSCPIYFVNPEDVLEGCESSSTPTSCSECCSCGYVQYESLIPYLGEIKHLIKNPNQEPAHELEFKLREQIIEISRLFDMEAGVSPGHFSKAHFDTTRTYTSNGTRYLRVPEHVNGTLQIRNSSGQLLCGSSYKLQDGFLVYNPCVVPSYCETSCSCSSTERRVTQAWPESCYTVTARWGRECADMAVQKAVRDYLIEGYRAQDPVVAMVNGLPVTRGFRIPHSWSAYLKHFRDKRVFHSQFAIA